MAIACPHCGNGVQFVQSLAGQNVSCPHCQQLFQMPAGVVAVPVEAAPYQPQSDLGRPRQKQKKGMSLLAKFALGSVLAVVGSCFACGLIGALFGDREKSVRVKEDDEPIVHQGQPEVRKAIAKPTVKHGITLENFDRIQTGMSQKEVESMLGKGDPISRDSREVYIDYKTDQYAEKSITVVYSLDGIVVNKFAYGF